MLDIGLLASGAVIFVVLLAAGRWAPTPVLGGVSPADRLLGPAMAGLLGGRLVAVVLDDPTSLGSLRSFLVIRGGVDFWPGVAVATAVLSWRVRRDRRTSVGLTLGELAPFALWGYASWEATCIVRDGCYGPESTLGLVPDGLATRQFPVGLLAGVAVALLGLALRHLWAWSPWTKVAVAVTGVAAVRAVAAIWLPRLGDGLTRPHLQSAAILFASGVGFVFVAIRYRVRRARRPGWELPAPARQPDLP